MKKTIALFLLVFGFCGMMPEASAQGRGLSAMFGYSTFYLPEDNMPYVETYLNFDAWTLAFAKDETGQYRATVEVVLAVRRNDTIAYLKKYDLNSPNVSDPKQNGFTFLDLQRFSLPNGLYDMELTLRDKVANGQPYVYKEKLIVYYQKDKPALSMLQMMTSVVPTDRPGQLSRGGYDMTPCVSDYYPATISTLYPYVEIYNLDKELRGAGFVVRYYVEKKESGVRVEGMERLHRYAKSEHETALIGALDITNLASGNYNLVLEVCDNNGDVMLKSQVSFYRSNPMVQSDGALADVLTSFAGLIKDEKKLDYYISALYPISSGEEIVAAEHVKATGDLSAKQTYLYEFWLRRSELDPAGKWNEYLTWLTYVDEHYSYPLTPGYRTDRGRVYLQYGPPDFVRDEKNFVGALRVAPSTNGQVQISGEDHMSRGHIYYLPYQLWRYNRLETDEPNRVFLFWDEMRSGFYKLLNSNARGEVRDPYWERRLSQGHLEENVVGEVGEQFDRGY